jgi:hypothetical protein
MTDSQEFRERVGRIDGLVQQLESNADPASRAAARELVQSLMDLHGGAIERILEIVSKAGDNGARIIESLGKDELVSSLLVLYELHPEDFGTRVQRGLEKARKFAVSRGASLDVLAIDGGVVRILIKLGGHSCGSTGRDIESAVRDALFETAPDTTDVFIDGIDDPADASAFIPLASLQPRNGSGAPHPMTGPT